MFTLHSCQIVGFLFHCISRKRSQHNRIGLSLPLSVQRSLKFDEEINCLYHGHLHTWDGVSVHAVVIPVIIASTAVSASGIGAAATTAAVRPIFSKN